MKVLKMVEQRNTWNDDRLDELAKDVKAGFAKVDARFDKVDARFDRVDARFEKVDAKFERLYHVLIGSAISVVVALIGCVITLIVAHAV